MKQPDDMMQKFIDTYIDSFVIWDLVVFYQQNPGEISTIPELVSCLGRKIEDVEEGVARLRKKGLLKPAAQSSFIFDPPEDVKKEIERFVEVLEDRNVRLHILTSLLKKGAR